MSNQQVYPKIEVSVLFIFAPAKKVCPNSIKVYGSDFLSLTAYLAF